VDEVEWSRKKWNASTISRNAAVTRWSSHIRPPELNEE